MKLPWISDTEGSSPRKPTTVMSRHDEYSVGETSGGLSVIFAILCIVDLFGVFPVVALPKSIIACGIYGIPLVLLVLGLQMYTAIVLGRCWVLAQEISPRIREKNRYPYAAVAEITFGGHARRIVMILIDVTVFSAGVPNLLVASQSLQLFWWKISDGEVGISYCLWMLVIGLLLCPIMWLGSPKDMKPLALSSVFIVTTVAVSVWVCILVDNESPQFEGNLLDIKPNVQDFLIAYGIIAFQFDIHPMLLTIQVDMKDSRRINLAVFGGFLITGTMFAVTSALAAYRYGSDVDSNILQGLPASIPLSVVALLVTLQLCLSSAVGNSALFQHIEDLLKIPRDFCLRRCLMRSSLVALAIFLGETVPRFDLVMGLVGSTFTGPLMFVLPPLFFLKLCYIRSKSAKKGYQRLKANGAKYAVNDTQNGVHFPLIMRDALEPEYKTFATYENRSFERYKVRRRDMFLASVVTVLGIAATALSTYSSWSDAIVSASFTTPCLVNATAAARSFLTN